MAEELKTESSALDMELEPVIPVSDQTDGDAEANGVKRKRDDGDELEGEKEISVEEERLENGSGLKGPVSLGFKSFATSAEIFEYFSALLQSWSPNINVNKYEHMMLLDLLQKGYQEPEKKIGNGVNAFQVRYHPEFKSRCFFIIRNDDSVDDFSFRKCVDHILPLPENMQKKPSVNKTLGGRYGGGGRGGGGRGGGVGGWRGRDRVRGGENGIFKTISTSYNKENRWISLVADQIITSSFMINNYIRHLPPPPPPPRSATPLQPGINDYRKFPKSPPPPPYTSPNKGHLSCSTTPLKPGMSDYAVTAKSPPPPPYTAPTIVPIIKLYDY